MKAADNTALKPAVTNSVFALAKPAERKRAPSPLPDLSTVVIKHDCPITPLMRGDLGKRISAYASIWGALKVGSCAELPERQAKGFMSYCRRNKPEFVARKLGDGKRGVWRTA